MLLPDNETASPGGAGCNISTAIKSASSIGAPGDMLRDLDTLAEHLRGTYVCQVTVDDAGHRRTHYYRNLAAVERAVARARERGRTAHVSLVQLVPVGVVVGAIR